MSVDDPGGGDAMAAQAKVLEAAVAADSDLASWFDQIVVPEGCRVELIEGEIVVTPPPLGNHEHDVQDLAIQVAVATDGAYGGAGNKGVETPRGQYIPDLVVTRRGALRDRATWSDAGEAAMVVEVTSSRPSTDREAKRLGYAEAAVPLYLLVDRERREVVLFADPADGDYRAATKVPFGTPLDLPDPFGFTLDTAPLA